MNTTVYVASGLKNARRVVEIQRALEGVGYTPIYDWASLYVRASNGEKFCSLTEEDEIRQEAELIPLAGVLILVPPYRRGAATEYGIAVGAKVPCVLFHDPENFPGDDPQGPFHDFPKAIHGSSCVASLGELLHAVSTILKAGGAR